MTIDGKEVNPGNGLTVYEVARQAGVDIPVLCHREGLHPTGGCGVCTVEDAAAGRLLPACATRAEASMAIVTASEKARAVRRAALELLLSNHPADCEAPCQRACPAGLPVPLLLEHVAARRWEEAAAWARRFPCACGPAVPCEKACRRRPLGGAVAICALHRWLAGEREGVPPPEAPVRPAPPAFRSRMTGLSDAALLALSSETGGRRLTTDASEVTHEAAVYEASRCLQCGCLKADDCRLRERCAEAGAQQTAFAGACASIVREHSTGGFRFDSSRCVLCGLCVRTAEKLGAPIGPAFHGRGFDARIGPPLGRSWDEVPSPVLQACVAACPTGAMAAARANG